MCGVLGIHPDPYTPRQIYAMYVGKQKSDWDHTARVLMQHANANAQKGKTYDIYQFHPYRKKSTKNSLLELQKLAPHLVTKVSNEQPEQTEQKDQI